MWLLQLVTREGHMMQHVKLLLPPAPHAARPLQVALLTNAPACCPCCPACHLLLQEFEPSPAGQGRAITMGEFVRDILLDQVGGWVGADCWQGVKGGGWCNWWWVG